MSLYDEFGDSLGTWGSSPYNTYNYTGQEYDAKPAYIYNLRAREYYPKLGRFMQNDPIGDKGGSLNWYLYVANNPINAADPTGKRIQLCRDGVHGYIRIKQKSGYSSAWGFYPIGAPYTGAYNIINPLLWWPGEVHDDTWRNSSHCTDITQDDCNDKKAIDAIYKLESMQLMYNLQLFNCWDWALLVIAMSR